MAACILALVLTDMAIVTYRDALNQALREEMQRDPDVFLMGEEVGVYQGAYKVSRGLLDEFGPMRIVDTPITELGFAGVGVGAAMVGLRPVIEFMTWNFALLAIDQLINSAAKMRYMSGGQVGVPAVFRGPGGSALQLGAQHSQAFESFYAHIPGLKVVMPATPADAKGLLKSAIRDDNPVVFIEGEMLYNLKGEVPEGEHIVALGKADVKRAGSDVTIICHSKTVAVALKAAEQLAAEEIDAEVRGPPHHPPAGYRGGPVVGDPHAPVRGGRGRLAVRGCRRAGGRHHPAGSVRRARRARSSASPAPTCPCPTTSTSRRPRRSIPPGSSPRCTRCCTATDRWRPRSSWRRSRPRWKKGASSSGRRARAIRSPWATCWPRSRRTRR